MADLDQDGTVFVGRGSKPEVLTLALANRHGLVTGATGTGKTVTLQILAESLSPAGVSVFAADVKGDLSGISKRGGRSSSSPAPRRSASTTAAATRSFSGTCLGSRAIRSVPRLPRWDRCFFPASWA